MINTFKHRCVRDLAWVIASPPLVSGVISRDGGETRWWDHATCLREFADCLPMLQVLDQNPQKLMDHLDSIKSKRLGLRFEGFVSFWFSSISPNFRLLAQNIQLNEIAGDTRSRTIGEIDFIIKELKSNKIIHLEVAVKFYLGTSSFTDPYRWFGTNTHDQLGKKIDHLKYHQTQLSLHHSEQLPYLIDERHCMMKGRLFYPTSANEENQSPHGVAKNHLRGRYLFHGDSVTFNALVPLEKSHWLAELVDKDMTPLDVKHRVQLEERARCYAVIGQNTEGIKEETERLFCLPETFVFPP